MVNQLENPGHVPVARMTRGGLVESVHYGSVAGVNPDGSAALAVGDPDALFYPRSALKPLQAVAMLRSGLELEPELLALAAASHSGSPLHLDGAAKILARYGLDPSVLANTSDLPYGEAERFAYIREGNGPDRLAQNCSGKHAAMAATCLVNGWPVDGYLDPAHPLQLAVLETVEDLTSESVVHSSTDGCGTPVFALSLTAMARAYSRLASAAASTPEGTVASAMSAFPEQVAGEGRDVTTLMRRLPGAVAKDGFEGIQLAALPDGRAVAVKISDGGDRARMPVTVRALQLLGIDITSLEDLAAVPVLGGGQPVGALSATDFDHNN